MVDVDKEIILDRFAADEHAKIHARPFHQIDGHLFDDLADLNRRLHVPAVRPVTDARLHMTAFDGSRDHMATPFGFQVQHHIKADLAVRKLFDIFHVQ